MLASDITTYSTKSMSWLVQIVFQPLYSLALYAAPKDLLEAILSRLAQEREIVSLLCTLLYCFRQMRESNHSKTDVAVRRRHVSLARSKVVYTNMFCSSSQVSWYGHHMHYSLRLSSCIKAPIDLEVLELTLTATR